MSRFDIYMSRFDIYMSRFMYVKIYICQDSYMSRFIYVKIHVCQDSYMYVKIHIYACTAGAARCNLCLEEKVCLLEADKKRILNKRSELFAKCCHRNSFSARKFERTRDASANR